MDSKRKMTRNRLLIWIVYFCALTPRETFSEVKIDSKSETNAVVEESVPIENQPDPTKLYTVKLHYKNKSAESLIYASFNDEEQKYVVVCQSVVEQYKDAPERCDALKYDPNLGSLIKTAGFSRKAKEFRASEYRDQNKIWKFLSYFFKHYPVNIDALRWATDIPYIFTVSDADENQTEQRDHETSSYGHDLEVSDHSFELEDSDNPKRFPFGSAFLGSSVALGSLYAGFSVLCQPPVVYAYEINNRDDVGPKYPQYVLQPESIGENRFDFIEGGEKRIEYLDENQRKALEVEYDLDTDKFLFKASKNRVSTTSKGGIFVMDKYGRIYVGESVLDDVGYSDVRLFTHDIDSGMRIRAAFYHSSFLSGDNVAAAGEIVFEDGNLIQFNNATGHYKVPAIANFSVLAELACRGYHKSVKAGTLDPSANIRNKGRIELPVNYETTYPWHYVKKNKIYNYNTEPVSLALDKIRQERSHIVNEKVHFLREQFDKTDNLRLPSIEIERQVNVFNERLEENRRAELEQLKQYNSKLEIVKVSHFLCR